MKVKEHYDKHLANFYSWMCGDFDTAQRLQQQMLIALGIQEEKGGTAIDLGCGHGIHSVALANLGYAVTAVDFNRQLLDELDRNKMSHNIELICADILEFTQHVHERVNVITCMGDTLAHLPAHNDIATLFSKAKQMLLPKGKLMLSFRDSSIELKGTARFIHVKGDHTRSLTCFIERVASTENHPEHILVHDILLEKTETGWQQKVSAYPKLILSQEIVSKLALDSGFTISKSFVKNGMIYLTLETT